MNGRLYDPVVGRFLSPDPYVQSPGFTQNFNRYSYCFNNPLKYIDPSGYMRARELSSIINRLRESRYGGTWSSGGGTYFFGSDSEAFGTGASYNDQFGSWGNTAYGSKAKSHAVHSVLSRMSNSSNNLNKGYFDYNNAKYYFDYNPKTMDFYLQGTEIAVNPFDYIEQMNASNGGGISSTGDKFYTESGKLLWNTNMNGDPNRIFLIPNGKMKAYRAKMHLYGGWTNSGAHQLAYSRNVGREVDFSIYGDELLIYPQWSLVDFVAAAHFFTEGYYSGKMSGIAHLNDQDGLGMHYGVQFGAKGYWSKYYTPKEIDPWWK